MIELVGITKDYPTRHGDKRVLSDVNCRIGRGAKVGILGSNGAGKSTLIRLISGAEQPTAGRIFRDMTVSWPLAFAGGFQSALTGRDNLKFIWRVYGIPVTERIDYVLEFSELGRDLDEPVRGYSAGMRAKLAFAASLSIDFDCYLIDEIVAVGDVRFQKKCKLELFEKRGDRAIVLVSHMPHIIAEYCDSAFVLTQGRMMYFDNIHDATVFYSGFQ